MNDPRLKDEFDRLKRDFHNVKSANAPKADTRWVYGAGCSWNGPIANVGLNGGLPACPHCRGMLFEMEAEIWRSGMKRYCSEKNDPKYPDFMRWLSERGSCSPMRDQAQFDRLRAEFNAADELNSIGG